MSDEICVCGHARLRHFDTRNPDMGHYRRRSWCEMHPCECKEFRLSLSRRARLPNVSPKQLAPDEIDRAARIDELERFAAQLVSTGTTVGDAYRWASDRLIKLRLEAQDK